MIPGKKYKPEDFAEIVWRRRWYVVAPLVLSSVLTIAVSQTMPNRYASEALVLIVPPLVPKEYVKPTVTEGLQERLNAMQQQLLSRTRLERIVLDFDLYKSQRKEQVSMDELLEKMRARDIKITVPRNLRKRDEPGSFTVSYTSTDPKTAMLVTDRLASLFVQENLEDRTNLSDMTNQFLQSQVDDAQKKVQEQGAKLEAFRRANTGRLPSEVASNLQLMNTTQSQLDALNQSMNRDRERQLVIERTLIDEAAIASTIPPNVTGRPGSQPVLSARQELAAARQALASLELRLTPAHPDIRAQKRHIAELERKADAEALQQPVTENGLPQAASGDPVQQRRMAALRTEHESLGRGLVLKRRQAEGLQATVASYRSRVESAPTLESSLGQLVRDYETLQGTYTTLLRKTQDAQVASNLEQRQVGQQFRIIDSARLPETPASPNRTRLNMIGVLFGLVTGLGLAAFFEYRDSSLRTEEDIVMALSLPVVALVPFIHTTGELRDKRRRRLVVMSSMAAMVVLSFVAVAWKLRIFANWVR